MLREGVPGWLHEPLVRWIEGFVGGQVPSRHWGETVRMHIQSALHVEFRERISDVPRGSLLDVIDYLLYRYRVPPDRLSELEELLSSGGSAWRATPDGLERRVDETLQSVADAVFVTNDRPADYLKSAWHKAWGRNPDASGAHQDAVDAAEAAYAPIVSPDNDRATLGTIIRDIRAKPPKYQVRLQTKTAEKDVCRIVGMMELLWESQRRHGTDDRSRETIEEARDAVALATTLVHLAQQGGFMANGS